MPPHADHTSRVEALDLLRLVAVLAVVLYHFGFWGPAMQLGYVLFDRLAPADAALSVVAIVMGMTLLAWIVWRYVERPAQRCTREFLTGHAARFGWSCKLNAPARS